MSKFTVSEDTKIVLNGKQVLLEAGDMIEVKEESSNNSTSGNGSLLLEDSTNESNYEKFYNMITSDPKCMETALLMLKDLDMMPVVVRGASEDESLEEIMRSEDEYQLQTRSSYGNF